MNPDAAGTVPSVDESRTEGLPIVTLLTDFGVSSPYVAQMKAVLYRRSRHFCVVDLTHGVAPQDIVGGGLVIADVTPRFPAGTVHVCVVDPGVGSQRRILLGQVDGHWYVGPDNGLFSELDSCAQQTQWYAASLDRFAEGTVSATFHGRDIMAPLAADLALGEPIAALASPLERILTRSTTFRVLEGRVEGEVLWWDAFGNVVTSIRRNRLPVSWQGSRGSCRLGDRELLWPMRRTYADVAEGEPLALWGSSGRLELSVRNGNAAAFAEVEVGERVVIVGPTAQSIP